MKNLAPIDEGEDLINRGYVDGKLIPAGGSADQVLAKSSNNDYDVGWVNQGGGGSYLPLSGGMMTGPIGFQDATALPAYTTTTGAPTVYPTLINGALGTGTLAYMTVANWRNLFTCKQLFNSTAATTVNLSENYANFKYLVVLFTTNSAGTTYHMAEIRNTGATQVTASIMSGDWAYLKGATLTLSTSGSTYQLKMTNIWNKGLNLTTSTVDAGSKSEANFKIKQVWGIR